MRTQIIITTLLLTLSSIVYSQETVTLYPDVDAVVRYTTNPNYNYFQILTPELTTTTFR